MKRDMDLIRQLLLRAEAAPDGQLTVNDPLETYQVRLMIDAGLVDGQISEELTTSAPHIHLFMVSLGLDTTFWMLPEMTHFGKRRKST